MDYLKYTMFLFNGMVLFLGGVYVRLLIYLRRGVWVI